MSASVSGANVSTLMNNLKLKLYQAGRGAVAQTCHRNTFLNGKFKQNVWISM